MSSWRRVTISALGRWASRNPAQRRGPFQTTLSATTENHAPSVRVGSIVTFAGCSGKEIRHAPEPCGSTATVTPGGPSSSGM